MDDLINTAFFLEGRLVYKKLKNRYRIFCMRCRRYEYVSKEQFKQIQASQICPMCYQTIRPSRLLEHRIQYDIMTEDSDGYRVWIRYSFGKKPKTKVTQVMYDALDGVHVYTRYIVPGMGGTAFCWRDDMKRWKKRIGQNYLWRFYTVQTGVQYFGKREYIYRALFDQGGITCEEADAAVKSNQKKIFMDNLLNERQMEYVVAFDLKSYEEVYKYRTYMKKNAPNIHKPLNVYFLDYLARNRLKLKDFYDYVDQRRALGLKVDKPRNFEERHWEMTEVLTQRMNVQQEELVRKRYAELLKKAYSKGDIQITPFVDGKEIRECAKQLHNCIAAIYLKKYANHETDLYCLKIKGEITVAIEVYKKKLKQARIDWNRECPPDLMKHIRKWCKANEFEVAI